MTIKLQITQEFIKQIRCLKKMQVKLFLLFLIIIILEYCKTLIINNYLQESNAKKINNNKIKLWFTVHLKMDFLSLYLIFINIVKWLIKIFQELLINWDTRLKRNYRYIKSKNNYNNRNSLIYRYRGNLFGK